MSAERCRRRPSAAGRACGPRGLRLLRRTGWVERDEVAVAGHIDELGRELRGAAQEARRVGELLEDVARVARPQPEVLTPVVREDLRQGIRLLRRAPGLTAAALLTLALGIGATSAIFSVVRTVMLQPLPYADPDRVVAVWETNRSGDRNVIAPANFVAWRERTQTLEHLGMAGPQTLAMVINGQPEEVHGMTFSADAFRALGVQPLLGRAYTAEEDSGGDDGVIVVSYEFWQKRLGGRPDVLTTTLTTEGRRRAIVGVMPQGFTVVGRQAGFLIPYGQSPEQLRAVAGRGNPTRLHGCGRG